MSRELIAKCHIFGVDHLGDDVRDTILALATKALDTERDAALGKAVRGEFDVGCARPDRYFDSVANMLGRHPMARDVLRAISAHLRDEQKGGV